MAERQSCTMQGQPAKAVPQLLTGMRLPGAVPVKVAAAQKLTSTSRDWHASCLPVASPNLVTTALPIGSLRVMVELTACLLAHAR